MNDPSYRVVLKGSRCLPRGVESSELFGDNNTRVRSTSVLLSSKSCTVNNWNEVVNPFLPLEFVSLYKIMFSVQVFCVLFQPMTSKSKARRT